MWIHFLFAFSLTKCDWTDPFSFWNIAKMKNTILCFRREKNEKHTERRYSFWWKVGKNKNRVICVLWKLTDTIENHLNVVFNVCYFQTWLGTKSTDSDSLRFSFIFICFSLLRICTDKLFADRVNCDISCWKSSNQTKTRIMSDEMDECACFWSHEFAMRRLLALVSICFHFNWIVYSLESKILFLSIVLHCSQLRQGQAYCTDSECIDRTYNFLLRFNWFQCDNDNYWFWILVATVPLSGPSGQRADDGNNFVMMSMLMIFAVILYLFRPNSLRRSTNDMEKNAQEPPNNGQVTNTIPSTVFRFFTKTQFDSVPFDRVPMVLHQVLIDAEFLPLQTQIVDSNLRKTRTHTHTKTLTQNHTETQIE